MSKKVSIIVPVYNTEDKLHVCLDSILSQDYKNIEIVLVNDGSKDKSLDVCKAFAGKDSRIIVLDKENSGPGGARNTGLVHANGDYVLFVDADDYYCDTSAISRMVEKISGNDLLICDYYRVTDNKKSIRSLSKEEFNNKKEVFLNKLVNQPGSFYFSVLWNKMYRLDLINKHHLRFDEHISWGEDFCFNMGYYGTIENVVFFKHPSYCYVRTLKGQTWRTMFKIPKNIVTKVKMYRALKHLYTKENLYRKHWRKVNGYLFYVTLID